MTLPCLQSAKGFTLYIRANLNTFLVSKIAKLHLYDLSLTNYYFLPLPLYSTHAVLLLFLKHGKLFSNIFPSTLHLLFSP